MKYASLIAALALGAATTAAFAQGAPRGAFMERLRAADTNQDGLISRAEAAALPKLAEHFDAIDANHDGQLSAEELRAAHHRGRGVKAFQRADTNGDGVISRDEFLAQAASRFDKMDLNHDGAITPEEIRASRQAWHGAR
jgi:Ca2+-binding EF-hand superfamily protein